jgi:hypothetical protein
MKKTVLGLVLIFGLSAAAHTQTILQERMPCDSVLRARAEIDKYNHIIGDLHRLYLKGPKPDAATQATRDLTMEQMEDARDRAINCLRLLLIEEDGIARSSEGYQLGSDESEDLERHQLAGPAGSPGHPES